MTDSDGVLIGAESFADRGGWKVDTQFVHIMGAPYLLAHGLGRPVAPAQTTVTLPAAGRWFVWVRTKNWVPGPWEAPGRFKLAVNGQEFPHVFGAGVGEWSWELAGAVELASASFSLSLIDLTGFDGRCDSIFLTQDEDAIPDNSSEPMNAWRRRCGRVEDFAGESSYDLVVVGGGIAGTSAAVAAARAGLSVALVQNRSVLGGNGSPEVHVGPTGKFPPGRYPSLGDIVKEVAPELKGNVETTECFQAAEDRRRQVVDAEPNLELLLDHHVYSVETEGGRIVAVWALNTKARQRRRFAGGYFVDATGHGTVGFQAGAACRMEPGGRMGMTNIWRWRYTGDEVPFPETPWALQLSEKAFPYPTDGGWLTEDGEVARPMIDHPLRPGPAREGGKGDWHWESGFDKHPLNDLEVIRDHNMRAAFGAFNAIKNHGAYAPLDRSGRAHATAELFWMAYIGGPRETLQLLGDVVVSENDVYSKRDFPDACVPATWGIDLHYPLPLFERETPDNPFISRAHFDGRVDDSEGKWADSPKACVLGPLRGTYDMEGGYLFPYRSFYSRNIENLFMAGRNLSCTHEALGTVRVMNTLGMVGVVVGRAASLACKHNTSPRGVHENHWDELSDLLDQPGDYRQAGDR
jgi:hypothetical protein